jgi:hypothetical protein
MGSKDLAGLRLLVREDEALVGLVIEDTLQKVYLVADIVVRNEVQFVFQTDHGAQGVEPAYTTVTVLQKPFEVDDLARTIKGRFAQRA